MPCIKDFVLHGVTTASSSSYSSLVPPSPPPLCFFFNLHHDLDSLLFNLFFSFFPENKTGAKTTDAPHCVGSLLTCVNVHMCTFLLLTDEDNQAHNMYTHTGTHTNTHKHTQVRQSQSIKGSIVLLSSLVQWRVPMRLDTAPSQGWEQSENLFHHELYG